MKRTLVLLLLFLIAPAADVRVDASRPWEDKDGYTPVVVRIEALIEPVEVRLEARLGSARATDRLRVEPGRPATRTMLLPSNVGWGQPELTWSTPGGSQGISVPVAIDYRGVALLVLDPKEQVPVPDLLKLVEAQVQDHSRGARGGSRGSHGDRVRRIATDALPDRWQGWPAWLTLLTTAEGEALLDQRQREAISVWTRLGGRLLTTDAAAAERWRRAGVTATLIDPAAEQQKLLIARLNLVTNEDGRPAEHPVPGTAEVPTAWFMTLAIAFAVIAGPVNVWWVMRRRRQPWLLLVSTPVISAGTCVLLIVVALLSDGIGRRRSAVQISLLDQPAQRAAVFSGCTWFCGIAPGAFALDAEERLVPMDEIDWRGGGRNERPELALDWTAGQRAMAGWIPARINRQLASTRFVPERRRVTLTRSGNGWRVGNGLDVAISELHWRDAAGMPWLAHALAPGEETVMQRGTAGPPELAEATSRLTLDARLALDDATTAPGWWIARLERPLHPLPGPEAEDSEPIQAWAVGRSGPAADGGP